MTPQMTRRALLLLSLPLAAGFGADPAQEVLDLITGAAASLSAGNAAAFLAAFDPAMPGYEKLRANITALQRQAEVQSFIDLVEDEGDDRRRTLELDWVLRIRREQEATASRREQRVKCRVEKSGKKWRIVALEPLEFFAPPPA
jgi:hypothetical protein